MTTLLYNILIAFFRTGIRIASVWNEKAGKWVEGRKNIFEKIKTTLQPVPGEIKSKIIWIHCSSLGEFEQGRPVMESLKTQYPGYKLLLTFFSPSGYEVRKNYEGSDYVFYLPMDSKKNAQKFLDLIAPDLVIFIKYDYWYHYLNEIKNRNINCLLISAVFRKDQAFFKWFGILQRKMLSCFTYIFVQTEESKQLLRRIGFENCSVSGDTRFDRVIEIARKFKPIPEIEKFLGSSQCIVAGSTWKEDEEALARVFHEINDLDLKLIIAPHVINELRLKALKKIFPQAILFSQLITNPPAYPGAGLNNPPGSYRDEQASPGRQITRNYLVIDNIGMLSSLYKYGNINLVGGGFTKDGVHNVLEAAVYGKPVVFGANYKKYKEAVDLVESECAKSFSNYDELYHILITLLLDEDDYRQKCGSAENYIIANAGATSKIMQYIQENRLLTS